MPDLNTPIESLNKILKPQIAALKKLGILYVRDLLLHFPFRYLDFSMTKKIKDLKPGENISLKVTIKTIKSRFSFRGRMSLAEAVVSDDTGSIKIVWFNQPYLANSLKPGEEIFLAGTPEYYKMVLQLANPIYEKASEFPIHTSRLVPLYHLKQSLYPKTFRNLIASVIDLADKMPESLPVEVLNNQALLHIGQTIRRSHFPKNESEAAEAKKRLAFEEIFLNQLLAQKHKLELLAKESFKVQFDQKLVKDFVDGLPFKLTADQKKAAWQVLKDMQRQAPMNRLLEGDVGSGKTLVALIAALQAVSEGFQAVLLAPTEILAKQHFQTAQRYLADFCHSRNNPFHLVLLTNHYSKVDGKDEPKAKLNKLLSEGMPSLAIGTHALLEKNVRFKNLALAIIDEQHRFGVDQRAKLIESSGRVPHLLSLSATPIPRTLKLAYYGELDISQIKTKPLGRKSIATRLVAPENRQKAYEFIKKQVRAGRQAFVITPLVEESDKLGVRSAMAEKKNLELIFPLLNISLMHGRLKGTDKEKIMNDFLANKSPILVATSVVEVGVDVPNASVMLIEGAERFGLAQLHQFRGRVGRSEHQSYCFLFPSEAYEGYQTEKTKEALDRLEQFTKTQDGFMLAELDLKQRGFGDIYGLEQSGWDFRYFDPTYTSLIPAAREEALKILKTDLNLVNYPLLKEKIKDKIVHFE
jgi:ATP-dependent DNA helicase RecG